MLQKKTCSDSDNGSKGEFGTEDIAKPHLVVF